jgi:hypothetical protein
MPVSHCPSCGYDVRAMPAAVCPECGAPVPSVAPPKAPVLVWRLAVATVLLMMVAIVGYVQTFVPAIPQVWGVIPFTVLAPLWLGWPLTQIHGAFALWPLMVVSAVALLPVVVGACRIRWWSILPLVGLQAVAGWWFIRGVRYGVEYQSVSYVLFCGAVQVLVNGAFVFLVVRSRRRPSFRSVAGLHGLACIWLASYAFPYMGELP